MVITEIFENLENDLGNQINIINSILIKDLNSALLDLLGSANLHAKNIEAVTSKIINEIKTDMVRIMKTVEISFPLDEMKAESDETTSVRQLR